MTQVEEHEGLILPESYGEADKEATVLDSSGREVSSNELPPLSDIVKGFVAGLAGGLAGTAAKSLAEQVFPPRSPERRSPPVVAVEMVTGEEVPEDKKELVQEAIHWPFGTLMGGAYGAVAEALPAATTGYGAAFGLTVLATTHESTMPALGITPAPTDMPAKEHVSELFSHTLYGVTTELVRRTVRDLLD